MMVSAVGRTKSPADSDLAHKKPGMAARLDLGFLKVECLEVVACFVTMSEAKTTLNDQKDQCSDIYCKTNERIYEG